MDNEIFEDTTPLIEPEVEPSQEPEKEIVKPIKEKKGRKPLSDERKQQLRDNLKRGREKSLETRKKNRELKKIQKEKKEAEDEELLLKTLEKKKNSKKDQSVLLEEISVLKAKLAAHQENIVVENIQEKVPTKKKVNFKKESVLKPVPTIVEEEEEYEPVVVKRQRPTQQTPKTAPPPVRVETQAEKNRKKYLMMRGLR